MIELRWLMLENPTSECVISFHDNPKILQYRKMIDKSTYAGLGRLGPYPFNMLEWSDWLTVPEVPSER